MSNGIYCYVDKKDNSIVYIGKDNQIHRKLRYYRHKTPSAYNEQQINKIIQNNPNRYQYETILKGNMPQKILNGFEMAFIQKYNPKFNYTQGGEGTTGLKGEKHPLFKKEARVTSNGKNGYTILANGKTKICSSIDKRFLEELCDKINNGEININEAKRLNKENRSKNLSLAFRNKPHSKKWADNQSNNRNKTGFFRVTKNKDKQTKQGYVWKYSIPNQQKTISSQDIFKLKQKIESRNFEWKIIDLKKAIKTIKGVYDLDL